MVDPRRGSVRVYQWQRCCHHLAGILSSMRVKHQPGGGGGGGEEEEEQQQQQQGMVPWKERPQCTVKRSAKPLPAGHEHGRAGGAAWLSSTNFGCGLALDRCSPEWVSAMLLQSVAPPGPRRLDCRLVCDMRGGTLSPSAVLSLPLLPPTPSLRPAPSLLPTPAPPAASLLALSPLSPSLRSAMPPDDACGFAGG